MTPIRTLGRQTFASLAEPELPPVLPGPGRVADRDLDADRGPVLAGAATDRFGYRPRCRGGLADAAGTAARTVRRGGGRPAGQAQADDGSAVHDGTCWRSCSACSPSPTWCSCGRSTCWPSCSGLNNCFENPARQSFVLEMVGPGPPAQRGQPQLGPGQRGPRDRSGGGRPDHHGRRHRHLLPAQRGQLRGGGRLAGHLGHLAAATVQADGAGQGPAARRTQLRPAHASHRQCRC